MSGPVELPHETAGATVIHPNFMTPTEATSSAQLLHAFRQLTINQAWKEIIAPKLMEAHERHLLGLSDRSITPDERTAHVEAYHLAKELESIVPERIAALEKQLNEWMQRNDIVDSRIADALGA
jgi:hypothetical protein